MSRSRNITKRTLLMLLVAWITFMSVFHAYEQTTQCAEWVAGVVTAVGGAPLLTALMIGGVVVAGGIAIHELAQTDAEDWRNFANGIKQGFNEFVSEQETIIAKEQDQTLSDQEAANIGVAVARDKVNGFFSNAVNTTKNTVTGLTLDVMEYWNLYSKIIGNVADSNISNDIITPDSIIVPNIYNIIDVDISSNVKPINVLGTNTFYDDDHYFIKNITTKINGYNNSYVNNPTSDPGRIYYNLCIISQTDTSYRLFTGVYRSSYKDNRVESQVDAQATNFYDYNILIQSLENFIENTNCQTFIVNNHEQYTNLTEELRNKDNVIKYLAIGGASASVPIWENTLKETLNNTKVGQAIQTGRRTLVNNGDHIIGVFQEDSVPVRKSGVVVQDGVISAPLGWDIPAGGVWDDVFSGGKPYADVVGSTGAIGVPDHVITGTKSGDTVIEYPDSADVQDTADYPRAGADDPTIDDSKPQEIPDKPQQEIIEDQGGSFYPAVMDLTNIFPFCIPFDIIYLVDKFDIHGERAPVIEIPIVYPTLLQSSLGESYTVVIDFNDFLVVRNVLRIFLLILFIVGLLKITRDLIRG